MQITRSGEFDADQPHNARERRIDRCSFGCA
jgi:hypothetical protein